LLKIKNQPIIKIDVLTGRKRDERSLFVIVNKISYLPIDRALALVQKKTLPTHTNGTVLFADVSGFSRLANNLRQIQGDRLGAETLINHLNDVFFSLITQIHQYGGAIIGFSGDAITCWFSSDRFGSESNAALHALTTATILHDVLADHKIIAIDEHTQVELRLKVALASGSVQRYVVGDPDIQLMDVLVGETMNRMAIGEQLAHRGEIIIDSNTHTLMQNDIQIGEWRIHESTQQTYGVLNALYQTASYSPWMFVSDDELPDDVLAQWLLPHVARQLEANLGDFLTELRPAVALFMRFTGLDYDNDVQAGEVLNRFVRQVQRIIHYYEGNLLQVTFGDKGSYLYAAFGAPISKENDTERAVLTALALNDVIYDEAFRDYNLETQIGVSMGLMRSGAYGAPNRRTYGVQGDHVNIAARLMTHASVGQVLVSDAVLHNIHRLFEFFPQGQITVKGQDQPIRVTTIREHLPAKTDTVAIQAHYGQAIVGREEEKAYLWEAIAPIFQQQFAGVVHLVGDIGMGKSRILSDLRRDMSTRSDLLWLTAPANAHAPVALLPFAYMLRRLIEDGTIVDAETRRHAFDRFFTDLIDEIQQLDEQENHWKAAFKVELERTSQHLIPLLGLEAIESFRTDNSHTTRLHDTALALRILLSALSLTQPVVLQIRDTQWLDADSRQVIQIMTRDMRQFPIVFIVTSRFTPENTIEKISVAPQTPYSVIEMLPLRRSNLRLLLAQVLQSPLADDVLEFVYMRSAGNPFFAEQLTHDMVERGLLEWQGDEWGLKDESDLESLPDGVRGVMIAQLDRLPASLKALAQTASVLGREFDLRILERITYTDNIEAQIQSGIEQGVWRNVTPRRYQFSHILLRNAAYSMQLEKQLKRLHQKAAIAFETVYPHDASRSALIADHWSRTEYTERQYHHLVRAAQHARQTGAYDSAYKLAQRADELCHMIDISDEDREILDDIIYISREETAVVSRSEMMRALKAYRKEQGFEDDDDS